MTRRRDFLGSVAAVAVALPASASASASDGGGNGFQSPASASDFGSGAQGPAPKVQINNPPLPATTTRGDDHLGGSAISGVVGESHPKSFREAWSGAIAGLRRAARPDDPFIPWLATFDKSLDERALAVVERAGDSIAAMKGAKPPAPFEPRLYESLLVSASSLLDRCLATRRDMAVCETEGVRVALSYLGFLNLNPLRRNLLLQTSAADLAQIQEDAQAKASAAYQPRFAAEKQLLGLSIEAAGGAAEAAQLAKKEQLRTRLLQEQFEIGADLQAAAFLRYHASGSAFNYAQRYLRLLAFLNEDLYDAYRKLYSVSLGLQTVLGVTYPAPPGSKSGSPIPVFTSTGGGRSAHAWMATVTAGQSRERSADIIDALVLWTRGVIRSIELRAMHETEVLLSIPIHTTPKSVPTPAPPVPAGHFGPQDGLQFTFSLEQKDLPLVSSLKDLRVVAVGLSFTHAFGDGLPLEYTPDMVKPGASKSSVAEFYALAKLARLNATVTTPPQRISRGTSKMPQPSADSYSLPNLFLTNVRIYGNLTGDAEPALSFDSACRNIDPNGMWQVTFDGRTTTWFNLNPAIGQCVFGIVLHLRLRGLR